jgi:hypothetical protein
VPTAVDCFEGDVSATASVSTMVTRRADCTLKRSASCQDQGRP